MKVNHPVRATILLMMSNSDSYVNCSKYNIHSGIYFLDKSLYCRLTDCLVGRVPSTKLLLSTQVKDEFAIEGFVKKKTVYNLSAGST